MEKRIGILTSGGDTPGMNAAIRAVTKSCRVRGFTAMGIQRGYAGLMEGKLIQLHRADVWNIINKGGTILKTARSEEFKKKEGIKRAMQVIEAYGLSGIVIIGGDGSLKGAASLHKEGIPVIGLPGTIDNDMSYTEFTIGFDTCVNNVMQEINKIRDTMSSHDRVGVVEVMGNRCGDIALYAGIGGGAEHILVPEVPYDKDELCEDLMARHIKGHNTSIVVVAEGAGKGEDIAAYVRKKAGIEIKAIALGYIQRGGNPTVSDMILATRMGEHAVELLQDGASGRAVGIKDNHIMDVGLEEALSAERVFDAKLYDMAKMLAR